MYRDRKYAKARFSFPQSNLIPVANLFRVTMAVGLVEVGIESNQSINQSINQLINMYPSAAAATATAAATKFCFDSPHLFY